MIIAIIGESLNLNSGGVGTFIYDLCLGLVHRPEVKRVVLFGITTSSINDNPLIQNLIKNGVNIDSLNVPNRKEALLKFPLYVWKLKRKLKDLSNYDNVICNCHLKLGTLYGSFASRHLKSVTCIETYHNTYHNYLLQCTVQRAFIKHYICVSNAAKREMQERFKIPEKKITAIPNAVDRNYLRKIGNINCNRVHEKTNVLVCGRLSYEKNILTACNAFIKIKNDDIIFEIIGDGPQRKELETIIDGHSNIIYRGALQRNQVLLELNKSDLVIIPSLWEGRSIFMLEASAFNTPFILSDCPGLREPFNESALSQNERMRVCKYGYLVETNDIDSYCEAISHFLSHNELHASMRKAVEEMSLKNDISILVQKYMEVFNNAIACNRP